MNLSTIVKKAFIQVLGERIVATL